MLDARRVRLVEVGARVVVQIAGAIVGALLVKTLMTRAGLTWACGCGPAGNRLLASVAWPVARMGPGGHDRPDAGASVPGRERDGHEGPRRSDALDDAAARPLDEQRAASVRADGADRPVTSERAPQLLVELAEGRQVGSARGPDPEIDVARRRERPHGQ